MAKELRKLSEALYPVPVVLVTCTDSSGKSNIITIAWAGVACSDPPTIGIAIRPGRYSHGIIKQGGEFVVNVPSMDILKETDGCGVVSGRDVDKFEKFGLTQVPSAKVKPPLIKECPVNIECRVKNVVSLGAHDLFLGEVVAVHVEGEILDEKGNIDYRRACPFVYNQGEYWSIGEKAGTYGFSKK